MKLSRIASLVAIVEHTASRNKRVRPFAVCVSIEPVGEATVIVDDDYKSAFLTQMITDSTSAQKRQKIIDTIARLSLEIVE